MQRTTTPISFSSYRSTVSNKSCSGTPKTLQAFKKFEMFSMRLNGMEELLILRMISGFILLHSSHRTWPSFKHSAKVFSGVPRLRPKMVSSHSITSFSASGSALLLVPSRALSDTIRGNEDNSGCMDGGAEDVAPLLTTLASPGEL